MLYLGFSYNFASDLPFVRWLNEQLSLRGIATWHLGKFDTDEIRKDLDETLRDTRYPDDWRLKQENWHATYLQQIQHAQGIVVVVSNQAIASRGSYNRGMWHEWEAINYIFKDRRFHVVNPTPGTLPEAVETLEIRQRLVDEMADWARGLFATPSVYKPALSPAECSAHNIATGRPVSTLPTSVLKESGPNWCELVRLDLYDAQWFCRRCAAESDNFIYGPEVAPNACPACGFDGYGSGHMNRWHSEINRLNHDGKERHWRDVNLEIVQKSMHTIKIRDRINHFMELGDLAKAEESIDELEIACRAVGFDEQFYHHLMECMIAFKVRGASLAAERTLERLEALQAEVKSQIMLLHIVPERARLLIERGEYQNALTVLLLGVDAAREMRDWSTLTTELRQLITARSACGDWSGALGDVAELKEVCQILDDRDGHEAAKSSEQSIVRNMRAAE